MKQFNYLCYILVLTIILAGSSSLNGYKHGNGKNK